MKPKVNPPEETQGKNITVFNSSWPSTIYSYFPLDFIQGTRIAIPKQSTPTRARNLLQNPQARHRQVQENRGNRERGNLIRPIFNQTVEYADGWTNTQRIVVANKVKETLVPVKVEIRKFTHDVFATLHQVNMQGNKWDKSSYSLIMDPYNKGKFIYT